MKYLWLIALLSVSGLFASDSLDGLLQDYEQTAELSNKTKKENAGHVIVFTRDDIQRMQAESLKDLLKSVRLFRYMEGRTGEPDLLNMDPVATNTKSIKIYLNDTELAMPIMGSGFAIFGDIDLDLIDHVEVYEGFPSFDFGIEPGLVVIRLYTKLPQRDAGSRVKFLGASYGSHKENIYTTGYSDDLAYFAYLNHSQNSRDTYDVDGNVVKRDVTKDQFYGSLQHDKVKFELNALKLSQDAFLSSLPFQVPYDTSKERNYLSATFNTSFLQDSLSLHVDYIHDSGRGDVQLIPPVTIGGFSFSTMQQNYTSDVVTAIVKKKLQLASHDLTLGMQFRHKSFDFDDVKYDGVTVLQQQAYDKEQIYSLFAEDVIAMSQNHLLSFSLSQQAYRRNKDMQNENVTQVRASYVFANKNWSAKTFASSQEFIPEPYMTAKIYVGNPSLKTEKSLVLTEEISYTTDALLAKVVFGASRNKDSLIPDAQGKMQNAKGYLDTKYIAAELNYFFRQKDKLTFAVDLTKIKLPIDQTGNQSTTIHRNYIARMLNTFGKFDLFNEFIVNNGYEGLKTGYDYSAGVKYRANSDLSFALKGENIFNSGLTRKYYYNLVPVAKQLEVPVIDQKFMVSMEYLF